MSMSSAIFLAFIGEPIEQSEPVFEIKHGYECWNLKKFNLNTFIVALKIKIPPINHTVEMRNYKNEGESLYICGLNEDQYKKCSWGLLIPDSLGDSEALFLLNLYSPSFLYPVFYASDFGITRLTYNKPIGRFAHTQNQSSIFKTEKFVSFFKILFSQGMYGVWQLDRIKKWDNEDWRLFAASYLYKGLEEYDNSKNSFGWQRESADMASILEALFTAGDSSNEEVGYRLRKRIASFLSHRFPGIEKDVKELYKQRSDFVHGSFFAQIAKKSKHDSGVIPHPDFSLLYSYKEYVRWALVAYLYLAKLIRDNPPYFNDNKSFILALEESIINIELRKKIVDAVDRLFSFMPII